MGIAVKQNNGQPVWLPGGSSNEEAGIVPGYVESDGSGGLRMLYSGLQNSGGLSFTSKYMTLADTDDAEDSDSWTNRATVSGLPAGSADSVEPKNGGGYWAFDHHRDPGWSTVDIYEASTMNGTWSKTADDVMGDASDDLHDTQHPVGGAYAVHTEYMALVRPRRSPTHRSLAKSLTNGASAGDLTVWDPDFTTAVTPELEARDIPGMLPRSFYAGSAAWYDGSTLYAAIPVFNNRGSSVYTSDENVVYPELWKSTDDGDTWTPLFDRAPFIPLGPETDHSSTSGGSWDCGQIYTKRPVKVGSDWWFFYSGSRLRHDEAGNISSSDRQLMGLAIWDGSET